MLSPSFTPASELEQSISPLQALDDVNAAISSLKLGIGDEDYQLLRSVISEEQCKEIVTGMWDRIFNVGASRFSLRVLSNKRDRHPAAFIKCRTGDGLIDHVTVMDAAVVSVLNDGGTLVFDHSQEYIPEMQVIQENVESLLGCRCWIQCYVTQSSNTAFGMHGDEHPFLIVQLSGQKKWLHDASETSDGSGEQVIYRPGDIAFYPRGKLHDVHGTGELSVHLTVAFDGFDGMLLKELPAEEQIKAVQPRIGTSLPYSVRSELIDFDTAVRFAYNSVPELTKTDNGFCVIETEVSSLKIPRDFVEVLTWVSRRRSTTSRDISAQFNIDLDRSHAFVSFGLQNNLLIRGLGA